MTSPGRLKRVVCVRVPATTANLGSGFDGLGLALSLYNTFTVLTAAPQTAVIVRGEGAGTLPETRENLFYRALEAGAGRRLDEPMRVILDNRIPVERGLGSSASAIIGGLITGSVLAGRILSRDELLTLALQFEPHPDNLAAALHGGLVASALSESVVTAAPIRIAKGWRVIAAVPDKPVSTAMARKALPDAYEKEDAVFNVTRSPLVVAGLATGRIDWLRIGVQDRLHQPYRQRLVPGLKEILAWAKSRPEAAAFLSGSGSTMIALAQGQPRRLAGEMAAILRERGTAAKFLHLRVDVDGAKLMPLAVRDV